MGEDIFNPLEKTLILDMWDCQNKNADSLEKFREIVEASYSKMLKVVEYDFDPGHSIVGLLKESHGTTHDSPETKPRYRSFHIAACGDTDPLVCLPKAISYYQPEYGEFMYRKPNRIIMPDKFPESGEEFMSRIKDLFKDLPDYSFSEIMRCEGLNVYVGYFNRQKI